MQLPLVMAHSGLGDGTLDVVALVGRAGVIGGENRGGGADDGADLVVHGAGLGLVDQLVADHGAGRRVAGGFPLGDGHARVLVQVMVVVRLCAHDGTGLARLGEVDVGMRGGQGRIDGSDDGALLEEGGHFCFFLFFAYSFLRFSPFSSFSFLL